MKFRSRLLFFLSSLFIVAIFSSCNRLGMLLFYRNSKTSTVFKSSTSKKNYFVIKATTLSHCGCTELHIDSYKQGKRDFYIFYNDNIARKTIFGKNHQTNQKDTIKLLATPYANFTTAFDSLDLEIFKQIDSISIQKPKGVIYQIKRPAFKGFIKDPYYNK